MRISPSIASSNLLNIQSELEKINNQYEDLHIDIEDGNFVPNITFGKKMIAMLRDATELPFSVHLMVKDPIEYIYDLAQLKSHVIVIHGESTQYVLRYINRIHQLGMKAGIALNPTTSIDSYQYLLSKCDSVLIMTSEPDNDGEKFLSGMLFKIQKIRNIFPGEIWCDGGIDFENMKVLKKMNIDVCVMGRAIFKD